MKAIRFLCLLVFMCASPVAAAEPDAARLTDIHFVIPAGPGGGWDGTARGVGEALIKSGLAENVSFENMTGGGGGRAIARLIETAPRQQNTLLISSTPIIVRSLQGIFPQSFRDLQPIASVIADYSAFVVASDSPYQRWPDLIAAFQKNPRAIRVAGGSVRGSTDHFVIARAFQLAGAEPRSVRYIAYDGGGKAMAGILTGEAQVLSTGLSEAIDMARAGEVRILAITAAEPIADAPDLPTLRQYGYELEFANWRGFFAAKGYDPSRYAAMQATIDAVIATPEFETVRKRNGWRKLHIEGQAFTAYLETQERQIGQLMRELGFLKSK